MIKLKIKHPKIKGENLKKLVEKEMKKRIEFMLSEEANYPTLEQIIKESEPFIKSGVFTKELIVWSHWLPLRIFRKKYNEFKKKLPEGLFIDKSTKYQGIGFYRYYSNLDEKMFKSMDMKPPVHPMARSTANLKRPKK